MGKLQSKHAECIFVNANLNKALEEQIWKKKTGFNLANYNMDETISELSICLEDKETGVPLRVELPPPKSETETSKVLKLDQMGEDDLKEKLKSDETKGESRISIEEFECGVQFEGSENSKQEWSFTLYDFDGHGRITREDLASLLKALYDAVGSSIKLPPNGTKTLKLRLTVGQDNTQIQVQKASTSPTKGKENTGKSKDTKTKDSIKIKELSKLNNLMTQGTAKVNNDSQNAAAVTTTTLTGTKTTTTTRNKLSLEDQQQLVELVQENMERNHIKQLRRHHSDCRNIVEHHHHKRRHRNHCSHDDKPKECQDRRNYYLDLAGVENNTSKFQNTPTVPTAGSGFVQTGHQRSRSHDVTKKFDNVKRESERLAKHLEGTKKEEHPRSRSFDPQDATAVGSPKGHPKNPNSPHKHSSKFRPVSLPAHVPATVSPHYHRRHRHREKDHGLAMQQVAEWIEREHAWEINSDHVMVQRHEHHHIHEHHHHHHYHHYYEA